METEVNISNQPELCNTSTEAEEVSYQSPVKKKNIVNRRKNKFNDSWKNHFNWITRTNEDTMAKCMACGFKFSIPYGGLSDIKRHMKTIKHMRNMERRQQKPVSAFLNRKQIDISRQSSAAAVAAFAFHMVMHSHTYQ